MSPNEPRHRPSLVIGIVPKDNGPQPPPRPIVRATGGRPAGSAGSSRLPVEGSSSDPDAALDAARAGGGKTPGAGGKMSPEEALVVRADKHCQQCQNYHSEDGSCDKVDGTFQPDDACMRWFTPMGSSGDPGYNPGGQPSAMGDMGGMGGGMSGPSMASADRSALGTGS